MNKVILAVLGLTLLLVGGHCLTCYKCDAGFFGVCVTSTVTCTDGQSCYSGVGKAAAVMDISTKGCLAKADCNKTEDVTFPGQNSTTIYSMTKTCCDTDLCNAAPGGPGASSVAFALASITAAFLALI